ncbi:hypothetical protein QM467_13020 [Rhodoblastus sp. 17X3]|uniref:hypothetical protein n=1 Tax=Rhodoblastus sp. 17X3 TaxID=3047026 RepID=UPI0024B6BD06|nr:hypothetical protein [Rhodoblastus sp. 17X3]MDI9848978.1 hypothetical protein [Rhodoblastus sp. 17X3]
MGKDLSDSKFYRLLCDAFVENIEEKAESFLEMSLCDPKDINEVKAAKKIVRECHNYLIETIEYIFNDDEETKANVLKALHLIVAHSYQIGSTAIISKSTRKFCNYINTINARNARRKDNIQMIIETCAKETWQKKPRLRSNLNQTAREIRATVMAEISEAFGSTPPKSWEPAGETTEIERIRKRLATASKTNRSQIGDLATPDN